MCGPFSGEGEAPKSFTFDQVYDWNSTQLDIFDITARPLIDSAMEGYNGGIIMDRLCPDLRLPISDCLIPLGVCTS